jgi:hypothetical protein
VSGQALTITDGILVVLAILGLGTFGLGLLNREAIEGVGWVCIIGTVCAAVGAIWYGFVGS